MTTACAVTYEFALVDSFLDSFFSLRSVAPNARQALASTHGRRHAVQLECNLALHGKGRQVVLLPQGKGPIADHQALLEGVRRNAHTVIKVQQRVTAEVLELEPCATWSPTVARAFLQPPA